MVETSERNRATLALRREPTKERFDDAKPEELTQDEFVNLLLSRWGRQR